MSKKHYFKNGFTLIEMMVSLAIFSVVAVVALGSLIRIMSANQKAQSLHNAMTNIGFALESISRELRVGINYRSISDGVSFESMRSSTDVNGKLCYLRSAYRVVDIGGGVLRLQKAEATACGFEVDPSQFFEMISPNVTLKVGSKVGLIPNTDPDPFRLVTARLIGDVGTKEKTKTYFDVQTSVSQRARR